MIIVVTILMILTLVKLVIFGDSVDDTQLFVIYVPTLIFELVDKMLRIN